MANNHGVVAAVALLPRGPPRILPVRPRAVCPDPQGAPSLSPFIISFVQHEFYFMMAFEIFGAFLMRTTIPRIPEKAAKYAIPAFVSAIFSFCKLVSKSGKSQSPAILYVGDAGLDPVVASSLFFGCRGLSQQWFILQYWVSRPAVLPSSEMSRSVPFWDGYSPLTWIVVPRPK